VRVTSTNKCIKDGRDLLQIVKRVGIRDCGQTLLSTHYAYPDELNPRKQKRERTTLVIRPKPQSIPIIWDPHNILTPFDRQTAGTGGIKRISALRSVRGRIEVSIEGVLLPPLCRGTDIGSQGQTKAPRYNDLLRKKQNVKDLSAWLRGIEFYQIAHLWGPGFGDEAAAGMMWAPREMNLETQNSGIEQFLREYSSEAAQIGDSVYLKATAVSWDWKDNAADLLRFAEYEVSKLHNNAGYDSFSATLEAPAPGVRGAGSIKIEKQG